MTACIPRRIAAVVEPLPDLDAVREELIAIRQESILKSTGDDCAEVLLAWLEKKRADNAARYREGLSCTRFGFRLGEVRELARRMRNIGRSAA